MKLVGYLSGRFEVDFNLLNFLLYIFRVNVADYDKLRLVYIEY
jgi:hypothetical protein